MNKYSLFLACLLLATTAQAQNKKTTKPVTAKNTKEVKKEEPKKPVLTPYEKLFKDKKVKTAKGLITLHKIDGKLYFEYPIALLDKAMLLGSVVESVSNSGDAFAGQQAQAPLNIYFTKIDSAIFVRRSWYGLHFDENDTSLKNALQKNNLDPVISTFKILATSPDSTSLVFESTPLFVNGHRSMDPFKPVSGLSGRSTSYKADKSLLGDVSAFKDNVSVSSILSFAVTSTFFGFVTETDRPATIAIKRTLMLLPEKVMQPRLNDPRIGVAFTRQNDFSGSLDGVKPIYFANRWNLESKSLPIVFYIDNQFPADWIPYIKQGIERWNAAFEKIGYKNVLVAKMYPKDDPDFDPENIRYNCVKYAPSPNQEAYGPAWVDPRSGEILSASIYINHGVVDKITQDLFLHTAAADKRMRTMNMNSALIGDALRYTVMQKTGECLGLLKNYGGSSSIPVDSLRSATFTKKYGITSSVMDDAPYNFVAQPGDVEKGVVMTSTQPGVYDLHAIRWLYSPISGSKTAAQENDIRSQWITEKIGDPMYRYIKKPTNGISDPNALSEDLGDDKIKSIQYAYDNLRYTMHNMDSWLDKEDKDYRDRTVNNFAIINIKFYWYFTHVLANIGGIYQYERFQGDPVKAYAAVPRDVQRNSLLYLLHVLENLGWMNDATIEKNMDGLNGNASDYMCRVLFPHLMRWVSYVGYTENKDPKNSYSQQEFVKDIFDYVWGDALKGKTPSPEKRTMQNTLVKVLISNSNIKTPAAGGGQTSSYTDDEIAFQHMVATIGEKSRISGTEEIAGFGNAPRVMFQTEDVSHIWYGWLLENKAILEKLVKRKSGVDKANYEYLLLQVNNALGK